MKKNGPFRWARIGNEKKTQNENSKIFHFLSIKRLASAQRNPFDVLFMP